MIVIIKMSSSEDRYYSFEVFNTLEVLGLN